MSEPASISVGIAERYATAIFDIAQQTNALEGLENGLTDLATAIAENEDLRKLVDSPLISRSDQEAAILAVADKMGLVPVLRNALGLHHPERGTVAGSCQRATGPIQPRPTRCSGRLAARGWL